MGEPNAYTKPPSPLLREPMSVAFHLMAGPMPLRRWPAAHWRCFMAKTEWQLVDGYYTIEIVHVSGKYALPTWWHLEFGYSFDKYSGSCLTDEIYLDFLSMCLRLRQNGGKSIWLILPQQYPTISLRRRWKIPLFVPGERRDTCPAWRYWLSGRCHHLSDISKLRKDIWCNLLLMPTAKGAQTLSKGEYGLIQAP